MIVRCLLIACLWGVGGSLAEADGPAAEVAFERSPGQVDVRLGDQSLATYVFEDPEITRPYFADVRAPSGTRVTRNHPPSEDDLQDHATFHPGIWMAFGDLSGHDSWRLKAAVRHVEFVEKPEVIDEVGRFSVRNRYLTSDGESTVCQEVCRYEISVMADEWLLSWDSRFTSDKEFAFGDQEEMGLGIRLETSIAENQGQGGLLTDSESRTTAGKVWGLQAAWCDYSGPSDAEPVGVMVIPHPENFRACWWHVRDYGFFAANPFGRNAFTREEKSRIVVKPGDELRLRFGIVIHDDRPGSGFDTNAAAERYLRR